MAEHRQSTKSHSHDTCIASLLVCIQWRYILFEFNFNGTGVVYYIYEAGNKVPPTVRFQTVYTISAYE